MTDIVETPAAPVVPPFPALGSSNFNEEAYAAGSALPGLSAGIHAIGVAAHVNATVAKEARDAAVPAAAQAVAARDAAVPAAVKALDAAQRAEDAAAGIQDGPVVSIRVRGGALKTGVVHLTAEELNTSWEDVPNKPVVIAAGDTQAAARAAIGAMPDDALSDAPPGEFRFTDGTLDEPKWLRLGVPYLRAAYPKSAARFTTAAPGVVKSTYSGFVFQAAEFSPDGNRIAFVKNNPVGLSVFNATDGDYSQIPVDAPPPLGHGANGVNSVKFSADGMYMLVSLCAYTDMGELGTQYSSAVVLYKNNGASYGKIWERSWANSANVAIAISPDAATILVCSNTGTVTAFPARFNFFSHDVLTGAVSTLNVSMPEPPPGASYMNTAEFSPEGSHLFLGFSRAANVVNDFPGYAVYRLASPTDCVKLPSISFIGNQDVAISGFAFAPEEGHVAMWGAGAAMVIARWLQYSEDALTNVGNVNPSGASLYRIAPFQDGFMNVNGAAGWFAIKQNMASNAAVVAALLGINFNAYFSRDGNKYVSSTGVLNFSSPIFSVGQPLTSSQGVYPIAQHSGYVRSLD